MGPSVRVKLPIFVSLGEVDLVIATPDKDGVNIIRNSRIALIREHVVVLPVLVPFEDVGRALPPPGEGRVNVSRQPSSPI